MLDTYVGVLLALLTVGLLNAIQTLATRKKREQKLDALLLQLKDEFEEDKDEEVKP